MGDIGETVTKLLGLQRRILDEQKRAWKNHRPSIYVTMDDGAAILSACVSIETLSHRNAELEAENARLSKVVVSGVLGELLDTDERDELVKFVKELRTRNTPEQKREVQAPVNPKG